MKFEKYHALGNDYLVYDPNGEHITFSEKKIIRICHRNFGLGSDGILVGPSSSDKAHFKLQILNPDGSEAEACGNGTRCVADLIMNESNLSKITIETTAGNLICQRDSDENIIVNMGYVKTDWDDIPLLKFTDTLQVTLENAPFTNCTCVNIGNPHAVFFCNDTDAINLDEVGPILEQHSMFPQGANIEFATVETRRKIRMRVWERGAGITEACGSGACAVLVAAVRNDLTERDAEVNLDGGNLYIKWTDSGSILMTGPAEISFQGEVII